MSIHYCADPGTIETVFRTIISVNQLSIYCTEGNSYTHFSFIFGINWRLHLHRGRLEIIKCLVSPGAFLRHAGSCLLYARRYTTLHTAHSTTHPNTAHSTIHPHEQTHTIRHCTDATTARHHTHSTRTPTHTPSRTLSFLSGCVHDDS